MTRARRFLSPCLLGLAFAACSSANTGAATSTAVFTEDTLTLSIGAQALTRDGGLRVKFLQLADSRCPANVMCVWEGDAAVKLAGTTRDAAAEVTIHTALDPRSMKVGGYELSLLGVLPYPGTRDSARAKSVVVRVAVPADPADAQDVGVGPPSIRGTITAVQAGGAAPKNVIRVEERPDQSSGDSKAVVTVTSATAVYERTRSRLVRIGFDQIRIGWLAEVWFTGPVAESYPVQARAGSLIVQRP